MCFIQHVINRQNKTVNKNSWHNSQVRCQGGVVAGADHEQPRGLHHGGLLPEVPKPAGLSPA